MVFALWEKDYKILLGMKKLIDLYPTPRFIVWDITYACPLRCSHCYSESGRRASRQLKKEDLLRVTDAMIAVNPEAIVLAGGEPLVVKDILAVMERFVDAGVDIVLYTSGWHLSADMLPMLMDFCTTVVVSIDGATARVHNRIRGRAASFERALNSLALLNQEVAKRKQKDKKCPQLAIDFVVMQSNIHQLRQFCTEVVPRFSELSAISFGAVIPTGLASRPTFVAQEVLSDEQVHFLRQYEGELQSLVPPSVVICTTDNLNFQLHPGLLAQGMDIPPIQVEPDGEVRAMPIYEGTVGSLLTESLSVLWKRAITRWSHPYVVEKLTPATNGELWAEATRSIDLKFGSDADRERIVRRPSYSTDSLLYK